MGTPGALSILANVACISGSLTRAAAANRWAGIGDLTAALRGWPIRAIERGVCLSALQRAAVCELATASLAA
jgi:hypothetical protein